MNRSFYNNRVLLLGFYPYMEVHKVVNIIVSHDFSCQGQAAPNNRRGCFEYGMEITMRRELTTC
jgi:hypothetical protein